MRGFVIIPVSLESHKPARRTINKTLLNIQCPGDGMMDGGGEAAPLAGGGIAWLSQARQLL